ncbi:MAG: GtrA family protein [Actinomycetota bacterium]|nr:GtrA family protein [Actinomycetota bacterium]
MPSTDQRPFVVRAALGLRDQFRALYREVAKFGLVGLTALVVDIGLFNYLRFAGGQGPMYDRPISAKIVSVCVATLVAYFGNRYWTFRHRGRTHMGRELPLFFLLNGVAMTIAIGCLYISHYVLGLTSALADNLSANVIGLGLGTLFRFWSYRKWVFPAVPNQPGDQELAERDAASLI